MSNYDFGQVVTFLKCGILVKRDSWDEGVCLMMVKGTLVTPAINEYYRDPDNTDAVVPVTDIIFMRTTQGQLVPWVPQQEDILAEDWSFYK